MTHRDLSSLVISESVLETTANSADSEFVYVRSISIYEFLTLLYKHNTSACSDIMSGQIKDRTNSKCICFLSIKQLLMRFDIDLLQDPEMPKP